MNDSLVDSKKKTEIIMPIYTSSLMTTYKERIKEARRNKARISLDGSFANPSWFGFLSAKGAFDNCEIECIPSYDYNENDPSVYDIILYHEGNCENKPSVAEKAKIIDTAGRYLSIQAQIRNERDANFDYCSDQNERFENVPIDVTISYSRNSTIVGNYYYTSPTSYIFDSDTYDDSMLFQGMCAFISNCVEERIKIVKKLAEYVPLRSYGGCLNNAKAGAGADAKMQAIMGCKFYLAFENGQSTDYVTEKYYQGFMLNKPTLLVYWGAPNIQDFSPTSPEEHPSFIDANQFETVDALGSHMKYLLQDKEAYNRYFLWRKTGIAEKDYSKTFLDNYSFRVHNINCKMCVVGVEMRIARKLLAEEGYEPKPGKYKIGSKTFRDMVTEKEPYNFVRRDELWKLWDIGYGRYWRKNNYQTEWNDLHYTTKSGWKEIPN